MATQFGKYLLQRKLAEGGMAEVFLAKQSGMEGFEKPVVVKRILPHLTSEESFVQMFLNEARVAARLTHPGIVQIFDLGKVDDQYFIAMEFIHGEDLRSIAKQAEKMALRPPQALVARIMADMLGALHYAHTRAGSDGRPLGLVHRDISPQNVLVTFDGGIKVVDFGIAKATESASSQQTQAGLLKGKYAYMSPEQCRGKKLDARSDIFAVGILLWELVTWRRLFRRDSDLATLVAVADEPIPRMSHITKDVAPDLDEVCARALERDLNKRYPSAQAMQADLEAVIRRHAWEADSITLQRYMRTMYEEKLRAQDEAVRAAGLGSLEDLLVRVEEDSKLIWMESAANIQKTPGGAMPFRPPTGEHDREAMAAAFDSTDTEPQREAVAPVTLPAGGEPMPAEATRLMPPTATPVLVQPRPSAPMRIAPVPTPPSGLHIAATPGMYPSDNTPSTMRHAVGQKLARADYDQRTPPGVASLKPAMSSTRRTLLVLAGGLVLGGAVLAAIFWPDLNPPPPVPTPVMPVVEAKATLQVILDAPAQIYVDDQALPRGSAAETEVTAQKPHVLRIVHAGLEKKIDVAPLAAGSTQVLRIAIK